MKHVYLHIGIIALVLITAFVHLYIGVTQDDSLLVVNGLGYVALLVALYIPFSPLKNFKTWFRTALLVYTLVTFIGYFMMHGGIPTVHAHGGDDPAIESQEDGYDEQTLGDELPSITGEEQLSGNPAIGMGKVESPETKPDYMGLGVKGIELVLMGLLSIDAINDRRKKELDSDAG